MIPAMADVGSPLRDDLLIDLSRRYCEPHRRYHTIQHIANMLRAGRELDLDDVQIAAVWFHDAIYEIPGPDNEERSALLAEQLLPARGWSDDEVAAVAAIVRDTKTHAPSSERAATVIDLDLMSLGAEWAVYSQNALDLRAEHAQIDDDTFRRGQRELLASFLAKERIFHTAWGSRFEAPARANIERALAYLLA